MKKIFLRIALCLLVISLYAQVSVNPNDKFYTEAQGWEIRGLLKKSLPLLRPYPMNVIQDVLNDVLETGNEADVELANEELERIFGKNWHFYLKGGFDGKISQLQKDESKNQEKETEKVKNAEAEIGFQGDVQLHDLVGIGYNIGFYDETKNHKEWMPSLTNQPQDSFFDAAEIGPFENYNNWNMNVQVGKSSIYAMAGVSRVGFGNFLNDELALNDSGYHSANLIFNFTSERWSYASVLESIGATTNTKNSELSLNSGKYLAFHSIKFNVTPKIDISYYENVLFGSSFNFAYIFPVPYMEVQKIGGANDNTQMGLLFDWKIIPGLMWSTDLFIDDFDVNKVVKADFDSKLRFGFQTGAVYYPEKSSVKKLSVNYQVVMPYVYSHWEYDSTSNAKISGNTTNYQNYMNSGVNIGSVLDPNSDKVSFSATFKPTKRLTLDFSTAFARHANSAEDFSDSDAAEYVLSKSNQYSTDGSAYMHQMISDENSSLGKHVSQAWDKLGFMTSEHKKYTTQAGISALYDFPTTKYGQFSLKLGYTFEYIKNANIDRNVYNGGNIAFSKESDGTYKDANGTSYATYDDLKKSNYVKNEIDRQKQDWINQLRDQVNNYISVSVIYRY